MKNTNINKIGLICIKDKKLLVVYKPSIGLYITPGGKIEPNETDGNCITREIQEELGCNVKNLSYFGIFVLNSLKQKCYLGDLEGNITLNPNDSINGYCWIDKNYKKLRISLAPMLEHQIIPELIRKGML